MSEKEGWGWPSNSKKAHYYVDSRSLCNKWMFFGRLFAPKTLTKEDEESSDLCTACKKALQRRQAKAKLDKLKKGGKIEL